MKKLLAMLLALVMILSLAACGGGTAPAEKAPAADAPAAEAPAADELAPVTLKIWFHGSSVSPEGSAKVMEELNKYLQEKINVTLQPIWGTWGDFDAATVTALAGGDDVDIYFTCNWSANEYNKYARDGYWVRLDDLLDTYAPELKALVPAGIWDCTITDGYDGKGIYAVPGLKDTATQYCWDINGTLLAELGYDVDAVCEAGIDFYSDEFEEMLKKAKEAKGANFYPFLIEPVVLERMVNHTSIVTGDISSGPVLSYYYDKENPSKDLGSTLVNKYATPEFKKYAERVYYLSQQGYISPSCQSTATANDYRTATQGTAEYLIGTQSYAFGCEYDYSAARGIDVRMIPEAAAYMDCTSGQGAMYAISAVSKNPERALMFLNLMQTDPYVMTTLNYGLEGYTYTTNSDGTITFTEERAQYTPWTMGMGNVRIMPATDAQGADYWTRFTDYYNAAQALPCGGYIFDNSAFETEIAALSNVYSEFAFNLMSGSVDPDTTLDTFLAKLEEAGINEFVAGANEQLAAYLG